MEAVTLPALADVICVASAENEIKTRGVIGELGVKVFEVIGHAIFFSLEVKAGQAMLLLKFPRQIRGGTSLLASRRVARPLEFVCRATGVRICNFQSSLNLAASGHDLRNRFGKRDIFSRNLSSQRSAETPARTTGLVNRVAPHGVKFHAQFVNRIRGGLLGVKVSAPRGNFPNESCAGNLRSAGIDAVLDTLNQECVNAVANPVGGVVLVKSEREGQFPVQIVESSSYSKRAFSITGADFDFGNALCRRHSTSADLEGFERPKCRVVIPTAAVPDFDLCFHFSNFLFSEGSLLGCLDGLEIISPRYICKDLFSTIFNHEKINDYGASGDTRLKNGVASQAVICHKTSSGHLIKADLKRFSAPIVHCDVGVTLLGLLVAFARLEAHEPAEGFIIDVAGVRHKLSGDGACLGGDAAPPYRGIVG